MSNCHDFGISNGCQPHCPVLRRGECDTQREMIITYILSGEWDIEDGSPCVEDGCTGTFRLLGCNCPSCDNARLECDECGKSAAEVVVDQVYAKPDISTDKRLRKPVAAEEPVSPPQVAKEVLPIHRAMSQAKTQSSVRPWVPFWLGQD